MTNTNRRDLSICSIGDLESIHLTGLRKWLLDILVAQCSVEERFRLPLFLCPSITDNLQARLASGSTYGGQYARHTGPDRKTLHTEM